MSERFDCIVVGAGPAGSTASYVLSKAGLRVLLLERGKYPGAKNVMGGRLYAHSLERIIPEFWKEAPVERRVTRERLTLLSGNASLSLDFRDAGFNDPPNSFTLLRSRFDRWLSEKAVSAGAVLVPNMRVDDLLWKDGSVSGIIAGGDKIESDAVIAADGAVSLLAEKAGLRKFEPKDFALGMKEIIELPEKTINERFGLRPGEGAAEVFIGDCTGGLMGGGFLYTNRERLSVGIVVQIDSLPASKLEAHEVLGRFNTLPSIERLIEGGKLLEYSAHVIPESGRTGLFTGGLLTAGDAAGLVLNSGFTLRGMDFAIASGEAAAKTVIRAKEDRDFSKETLSYYETLLREDFVLKDLETFRRAPEFLRNERVYNLYPPMLCSLFHSLFKVRGPKKRLWDELITATGGKRGSILRDVIKGLRAM